MAFLMPLSSSVTPAAAGESGSVLGRVAKICTQVQVILFIYINSYLSRSNGNETNDCLSKRNVASIEITTQTLRTGCIGS